MGIIFIPFTSTKYKLIQDTSINLDNFELAQFRLNLKGFLVKFELTSYFIPEMPGNLSIFDSERFNNLVCKVKLDDDEFEFSPTILMSFGVPVNDTNINLPIKFFARKDEHIVKLIVSTIQPLDVGSIITSTTIKGTAKYQGFHYSEQNIELEVV